MDANSRAHAEWSPGVLIKQLYEGFMPKVKNPLPEDKQSEKFEALVEKLKEDGHLAPEEADEALDKLVQNSPKNPR